MAAAVVRVDVGEVDGAKDVGVNADVIGVIVISGHSCFYEFKNMSWGILKKMLG